MERNRTLSLKNVNVKSNFQIVSYIPEQPDLVSVAVSVGQLEAERQKKTFFWGSVQQRALWRHLKNLPLQTSGSILSLGSEGFFLSAFCHLSSSWFFHLQVEVRHSIKPSQTWYPHYLIPTLLLSPATMTSSVQQLTCSAQGTFWGKNNWKKYFRNKLSVSFNLNCDTSQEQYTYNITALKDPYPLWVRNRIVLKVFKCPVS